MSHPVHPIVAAREKAPWAGAPVEPSPIPTMLSREELAYLTWLGAHAWTAEGDLLEIGPWLGGSSRALALGVQRSPHARPGALTCMDSFVWKNFMGDRSGLTLKDGDSFLPQFRKNLEAFGDLVRPMPAHLPDEAAPGDAEAEDIRSTVVPTEQRFHWPAGRPIEILFVDGAKSYSGLKHLLVETGASLLPGRSLLVFQDYLYWGTYWVPLIVELLGDRVQIAHVLRHNTVSFRVAAPLERAFVENLPDLDALDWQHGLELLGRAALRMEALGDPNAAAILRVAPVRFLAHKGRLQDCERVFRAAEERWPGPAPDHNLERCRHWLEIRLGRALPVSLARRWRRWAIALTRPLRRRIR